MDPAAAGARLRAMSVPVDPAHAVGGALSPGDRVAVGAITPCFACDYCQRGFTSQCQGMLGGYKFTGQRDGNMAEYFVVNDAQANLTPIPDDLPDEKAVYATDMLSTGFAGAAFRQNQWAARAFASTVSTGISSLASGLSA